jgi:hypothetical protein
MPYDLDSFDEVEATEGDFHTIATTELSAAMAEAELAMSKVFEQAENLKKEKQNIALLSSLR